MSSPGSLLIAWQLKDKNVLIVGAGEVASGRLQSVLDANGLVTLVAPSAEGLHPLVTLSIKTNPHIRYHDRQYQEDDLDGADMVLTAIDDVDLSRRIAHACRVKRIPVNAADIPPSCDFYFGSQIRRGPLQILVSTNGRGPKLANIIRTSLEKALPSNVEAAIENVGTLREKLRKRAPGVGGDLGKRRMKWMIDVCNTWSLDELAELDEQMMSELLEKGWESDRVPDFLAVSGRARSPTLRFDSIFSENLYPFLLGICCGISLSLLPIPRIFRVLTG